MPNNTSMLKEEIAQLRSETENLRKQAARDHAEIAALKQRLDGIEHRRPRTNGGAKRAESNGADGNGDANGKTRYSARSLAAQRKRLGLSAAALGKLFGVSAQSVYNWEAKRSRPREKQLAALAALRRLDRQEVATILARA